MQKESEQSRSNYVFKMQIVSKLLEKLLEGRLAGAQESMWYCRRHCVYQLQLNTVILGKQDIIHKAFQFCQVSGMLGKDAARSTGTVDLPLVIEGSPCTHVFLQSLTYVLSKSGISTFRRHFID